jgi:hypothetical protein
MNPIKRLSAQTTHHVLALTLAAGCAISSPALANGEWKFELTPYLWGATIGGSVATSDGTEISAPAPGDSSFFSLDNLQGAAFLAFEAKRGQWRLLADGMYVSYSGDVRQGPLVTVSEEITGYIFEFAGGYQIASDSPWEVLGGARYFDVENELDLKPGPKGTTQKTWVDPFVGVRLTHPLSENWQLRARADLGGFGINADLMQNYVLEVDYQMTERARLRLGYRYLDADFEKDRFVFDASIKGPAIGVTFDF